MTFACALHDYVRLGAAVLLLPPMCVALCFCIRMLLNMERAERRQHEVSSLNALYRARDAD